MTLKAMDDLIAAQKRILLKLVSQQRSLEKIRISEDSLFERWQQLLGVVLSTQIEVIQEFGFTEDQSGLDDFNKQLMEFSSLNKTIKQLNKDKWHFLLNKTFGISEVKKIDLQKAKDLIGDIAKATISEDFLTKVDLMVEENGNFLEMTEKRKNLLKILLPLHMSIMSQYGFEQEDGYIQAQRALMDHYSDPFIMETATHAQNVVFKRAKIIA